MLHTRQHKREKRSNYSAPAPDNAKSEQVTAKVSLPGFHADHGVDTANPILNNKLIRV
jgi:hypothetical protein